MLNGNYNLMSKLECRKMTVKQAGNQSFLKSGPVLSGYVLRRNALEGVEEISTVIA